MVELNKINDMCEWERKKAIFLLNLAEELDMNTSGYGEIDVNPNSGYTYLWIEDYDFCLYLPIDCELQKTDVYVLWTNPEDGEEVERNLTEDETLETLEDWSEGLSKKYRKG